MPLEVGYWAIRGLGAPLRMICVYAGVDYNPRLYQVQGSPGKWDKSEWFDHKPCLKKKNALINLPYIIDGDITVTQSNACLKYLGLKFNLNGKNAEETRKMEQCLCEVSDLRNNSVKLYYSPKMDFDKEKMAFLTETVINSYDKFETWLTQQGTPFLASDTPTVADFHFFELIDQIEELSKQCAVVSPLKSCPKLTSLYHTFQQLPSMQPYLTSHLHALPINNPHSSFTGKEVASSAL